MTVRQTLKLIGGAIIAFLFAILGIQRKKIVKQKEEIKEAEEEVKVAEAKAEQAVQQTEQVVKAVQQASETEQKLDEQQIANEKKIEEINNDEELKDFANSIITDWNNGL